MIDILSDNRLFLMIIGSRPACGRTTPAYFFVLIFHREKVLAFW